MTALRRLAAAVCLSLALQTSAAAQVITSGFINAGTACTTAGACVEATLGEATSVTVQIVGSFTATLSFEGTADGQTWVAVQLQNAADGTIATSTTAAGAFSLTNYGLQKIRVRASAYTSGGAQVSFVRGWGAVRPQAFFGATFSGQSKFADGTAAAPSITFSGDTDTGRYRIGANNVGEAVNGALVFDWNASRILSAVPISGGGVISPLVTVTTDATAGARTYTAAELVGGIILRDPAGGNRSDVTPTAANIVAAVPGAQAGQAFEFTIRNTADAAETITVTAGTGVTLSGTMTIAQNNSKRFLVVCTNVTASTEAVTIYSLGTVVH